MNNNANYKIIIIDLKIIYYYKNNLKIFICKKNKFLP